MPAYIQDLKDSVLDAFQNLTLIDEEKVAAKPAPGKWSVKEIIGHLIDSASNNHQRFVRAQFTDELVFEGYSQDGWVEAQNYQDANWHELLILWRGYNLHLAHFMETMPDEERTKTRSKHNLHQIASDKVPEDLPTSLDFFMGDYVMHLKHHLKQIEEILNG
ncbi:MAG: DinB family protein [Roseivirga sp.]